MFQQPDVLPGEVDFPPTKAHPGGAGVGMVVVMPTLAECEEGYPPVVAGVVVTGMAHIAPAVGG